MRFFLYNTSQYFYPLFNSERLTQVIAAKFSISKAAAKVETTPVDVSFPIAHLASSELILSNEQVKVFETKLVVPLVPRMIMPIWHMTKRRGVLVFFAQKVGKWTNGTKGWKCRKYRSSAISRISAGGKVGIDPEPVVDAVGDKASFGVAELILAIEAGDSPKAC